MSYASDNLRLAALRLRADAPWSERFAAAATDLIAVDEQDFPERLRRIFSGVKEAIRHGRGEWERLAFALDHLATETESARLI